MNPWQVMGVVACCVSLFVGVVTFLTWQGVPLLVAFLGVYLVAIGSMLGMQRRARESCEGMERQRRRHEEPSTPHARVSARGAETPYPPVSLQEPFRA